MEDFKSAWVTATEVLDRILTGDKVFTYITGEYCLITGGQLLNHSGYLQFSVIGDVCGKNTVSFHPSDTMEVSFLD
jgi:hypothetical protein